MAGITILIFGSSFTLNYYVFYCQPNLILLYNGISSVTCFGVFCATMLDFFHREEYVWIKGVMFGALGVGNAISIVHNIYSAVYSNAADQIPLGYVQLGIVFMGALYLTGLFFYIKKIPEKYFPYKFDIWLNSHTIFHIFVVLASVELLFTILHLYHLRSNLTCIN